VVKSIIADMPCSCRSHPGLDRGVGVFAPLNALEEIARVGDGAQLSTPKIVSSQATTYATIPFLG
jgi:hypothetical protein